MSGRPVDPTDTDALSSQMEGALTLLAPREREVASLRLAGKSAQEVARLMGIKPSSVRTTMYRVYRKFDVSDFDAFRRVVCAEDKASSGTADAEGNGEAPDAADAHRSTAAVGVLDNALRLVFDIAAPACLLLMLFYPYGIWRVELSDCGVFTSAVLGVVLGIVLCWLRGSERAARSRLYQTGLHAALCAAGAGCCALVLLSAGLLDLFGLFVAPRYLDVARYPIFCAAALCVTASYVLRGAHPVPPGRARYAAALAVPVAAIVLLAVWDATPVTFYATVVLSVLSGCWSLRHGIAPQLGDISVARHGLRGRLASLRSLALDACEPTGYGCFALGALGVFVPFCAIPLYSPVPLLMEGVLAASVLWFAARVHRCSGGRVRHGEVVSAAAALLVGFLTHIEQAGLLVAMGTVLIDNLARIRLAAAAPDGSAHDRRLSRHQACAPCRYRLAGIVMPLCGLVPGSVCFAFMHFGMVGWSSSWGAAAYLPDLPALSNILGCAALAVLSCVGAVAIKRCGDELCDARAQGELDAVLAAPDAASTVKAYLVLQGLNDLQVDVAFLTVSGASLPQIAEELHYSIASVKRARGIVYRRLCVHSVSELQRAVLGRVATL